VLAIGRWHVLNVSTPVFLNWRRAGRDIHIIFFYITFLHITFSISVEPGSSSTSALRQSRLPCLRAGLRSGLDHAPAPGMALRVAAALTARSADVIDGN